MPNWCDNVLELTHNAPIMIERAVKAFTENRLLDEFVPIPQPLKDTPASHPPAPEEEGNRRVYGYGTWYDFCVNEWGTKWDVGGKEVEFGPNSMTVQFDSAWAPPVVAYERLQEMGFRVKAYYYEPGVGFCGRFDQDGDLCVDMTKDQTIPEDIDKMFGITDQLRAECVADAADPDKAVDGWGHCPKCNDVMPHDSGACVFCKSQVQR